MKIADVIVRFLGELVELLVEMAPEHRRNGFEDPRSEICSILKTRAVLYTTAQHWKVRTSVGCVRIQLLKGANSKAVKCCVLKPPAVSKPRPLTYIV